MKKERRKSSTRLNKCTRLALVCALLSAVALFAYTTSIEASAKKAQVDAISKYGGEQIEVCVARKGLNAGQTITDSDIEVRTWSASMLPENSITNKNDCVGKTLSSSVIKGEVISATRFQKDTKSFSIPDNMTAISIPLSDISSVGGSLKVGDKIDIYSSGSSATNCIASKVEVLETSKDDDNAETKWITVAIKSELAKELVSAAQKTELYVAKPSEVQNTSSDSESVISDLEKLSSSTNKSKSSSSNSNSGAEAGSEEGRE